MIYLGDEGRDMLIVRDILRGVNLPLIGPPTSVGQLFLGPAYYYLITPFVWLFKMDPIGPAVFISLLGIFTIFLVYWVGRDFFDLPTAIFSAALYTVSPVVVEFSRSSWNPNPMPFFVLLLMLGLFYWQKKKRARYLYLAALSFGIMLQLHYLAILMTPFLIFAVYRLRNCFKNKKEPLLALAIVLLLISPLLIFDLRHDFFNLRGFWQILGERSGEGFSLFDLLSRGRDRIRQLFSLFLGFQEREGKNNLAILILAVFSLFHWKREKKISRLVIYGWFLWGLLALGFYRHSVYPHYLTFLFPFPALLLGRLLGYFFGQGSVRKGLVLLVFSFLLLAMTSLTWKSLRREPSLNVDLVEKVATLVVNQSRGQAFNFALLAENNYDSSYRYFFELWQTPVVYEQEVTGQLFVVCEDEKSCQPEGNSKWEIALFDAAYEGEIKKAGCWQPDPLVQVFKFVPK